MQKKASSSPPSKATRSKGTSSKPDAAASKAASAAKTVSKATAEKKAPPRPSAKSQAGVPAGKKTATAAVAHRPAEKPGKEVSKTVVAKKADTARAKKVGTATKSKTRGEHGAFLESQRQLLFEERQSYISSAEALKAQADSLALEHEPGDVQFDEEGGEGGTANVDREIDLYLSAQARATVVEIDRALEKIEDGTYGVCESCGEAIPEARLEALPYAALCVNCKSGGLSSRR
jgi:DnaK suppressor protein